jgi:flagellar P-ring protein precursor FlgI
MRHAKANLKKTFLRFSSIPYLSPTMINLKPLFTSRRLAPIAIAIAGVLAVAGPADAQRLKIRDICRLKGQEVNNLHGMGLVVGLKGTGDGDAAPTARSLSRMMQLMGVQMATDAQGRPDLTDVADAKNVALVFVTAQIPAIGAQQGDPLDLAVAAISAKSLEGGYLMMTPMFGPRADDGNVYAIAEGPLKIKTDGTPTRAVISRGGKMESTIRLPFQQDGKLTLVVERDFANFDTSQRLVDAINALPDFTISSSPGNSRDANNVRAIDQLHIEVVIPELYRDSPVEFVSALMATPITLQSNSNRVVINERDGIVIIGEEVTFAPALVTHKNLRVEANAGAGMIGITPDGKANDNPKLKALADALNALNVPTVDLIAIIKSLKSKGDLYGEVIFQ